MRGFYQTLRRLECERRDLPRIGYAATPSDEAVRLAQQPSLSFEADAIVALDQADPQTPARIAVSFFGVFGPNGPLPLHLTEYAYQRQRQQRDASLVRFADIFHHRLLTFLYRAWAESQPTVSSDRANADSFRNRLAALAGFGRARSDDATATSMLGAAGLLVNHTRHAEGLAKLLGMIFGVPARIDEFVGEWLQLPDHYCWRLDADPALGVLGESTRIGTEVWDCQSKFRVVLGPLTRRDYARFVPGAAELQQLVEVVRRYAGPELAWALRLTLAQPERQPAVLGIVGTIGVDAHVGGDIASHWQDLDFEPESDRD